MEKTGGGSKVENNLPFDSKWYPDFEKLGSFGAYEYLDGDKSVRAEQKEKFLKDEVENPVLDYPKLDSEKLLEQEQGLLKLKKDVLKEEENEIVQQTYRWKINEKVAEIRMLRASFNGDMRKFQKYSEFVYGKPNVEIFNYTLKGVRDFCISSLESKNIEIKNAASELLDMFPSDIESDFSRGVEGKDTEKFQKMVTEELESLVLLDSTQEGKKYNANEIAEIFEEALSNLKAEDWVVSVDPNRTAINVSHEQNKVKVPESRNLTEQKLRGLVLHEISTHVARRLKGERSRLQILGLGLDRYERGEEGIATVKEQIIKNKVEDFAGLDGYLAIGLAYGLDGKPRDFRQVYSIMESYFYLKKLSLGKTLQEAKKGAQTSAWNRTVRTFRGTDCKTSGVCFTKDMVYREGNIAVWNILKTNPEKFLKFSLGKYDPANKRHLWVLSELGISDKDLEGLEKDS